MPIYDLECKQCNKTYELMMSYEKAKSAKCEVCGDVLFLNIGNTSFRLLGKDWSHSDLRPQIDWD